MTRYLPWAVFAYGVFVVVQVLFAGFVAGVGPWTIDGGGAAAGSIDATAMMIDAGLVVGFGVVHSGMARAGFKRLKQQHPTSAWRR